MTRTRPYVLSIAGFDPSAGAGVLADIKTFEANKVYGFGVASALTWQNDVSFEKVEWISPGKIEEQISVLHERFTFHYVKVGLIESIEMLNSLADFLRALNPDIKIIWDPVMKASAGFNFHEGRMTTAIMQQVCKKIFLITPNIPEALEAGPGADAKKNAKELSAYCHVFLKGGHQEGKEAGRDHLFIKQGKEFSFRAAETATYQKHGSGCVLSSAVAANLAKGFNLHKACLRSKQYTAKFLHSHAELLGYHHL